MPPFLHGAARKESPETPGIMGREINGIATRKRSEERGGSPRSHPIRERATLGFPHLFPGFILESSPDDRRVQREDSFLELIADRCESAEGMGEKFLFFKPPFPSSLFKE